METTGTLSVLNTGAGDIRMDFHGNDDDEVRKACDMLLIMLRRGYAILVEMPDGTNTRAIEIDAERRMLTIIDPRGELKTKAETLMWEDERVRVRLDEDGEKPAAVTAHSERLREILDGPAPEPSPSLAASPAPGRRGRRPKNTTDVPVGGVKITAVGASAGG